MLRRNSLLLLASLAVVSLFISGCGCNSSSSSLTITGTLSGGAVGVQYSGTLSVTGGTSPYTWTVTGLPDGVTESGNTTATITFTGTPTTAGSYTVGVTVSDSNGHTATYNVTIVITGSSATVCAPRGSEGELTSAAPWAFLVQGDNVTSENDLGVAIAGSFTPNANGTITAADVDYNAEISDGEQSLVVDLAASSYSLGSDGRGCLYLAFSGLTPTSKKTHATKGVFHAKRARTRAHAAGQKHRQAVKAHPAQASDFLTSLTLSFALGNKDGSGVYHTGRIMEFDNTAEGGTISAGMMHIQSPVQFVLTALHANFAFGVEGWGVEEDADFRIAVAGTFANSGGVLSSGFTDISAGGSPSGELSGGSGQISSTISSTTGRGSVTYSIPNADSEDDTLTIDFAIYVIDAGDFYMISTDGVEDVPLLSGRGLATNATFGAAPLNGYYLDAASGFDDDNGGNYVQVGTLHAKSDNTVPTATLYVNDAGDTGTQQYPNMTYTVDAAGRFSASTETLPYPLVGYLTSGGDVGENISAFLVAGQDLAQASSSGVLVNLLTNVAPNYTMTNIAGTYAFGTTEDVDGGNGTEVGNVTNTGSGASGTFTSIVDISAVGESNQSGLTGSGTVAINADGSGTFTGGTFHSNSLMFVTNGSQIYAIDGADVDPLLYVFDEGTEED